MSERKPVWISYTFSTGSSWDLAFFKNTFLPERSFHPTHIKHTFKQHVLPVFFRWYFTDHFIFKAGQRFVQNSCAAWSITFCNTD